MRKNSMDFSIGEFFELMENNRKYLGALHLSLERIMHCYKYFAALPLREVL